MTIKYALYFLNAQQSIFSIVAVAFLFSVLVIKIRRFKDEIFLLTLAILLNYIGISVQQNYIVASFSLNDSVLLLIAKVCLNLSFLMKIRFFTKEKMQESLWIFVLIVGCLYAYVLTGAAMRQQHEVSYENSFSSTS